MQHKHLADWYRAANIEPDGESLPKRWAAIENLKVGKNEIVNAALLFHGHRPTDPKFLESFRAALQKADPAIKMSGNDNELSVLAGAYLIYIIEEFEDPCPYLAALALVCPCLKNLRRTPAVPDIPELATVALSKWSSSRFALQTADVTPEGRILPVKGLDEIKSLCAEGELPPLEKHLTSIYTAVQKMQKRTSELRHQLSIQSEETNMLWWLLGEHSRDTGKAFNTYTPASACLLAGKELSDLTRELPGPPAAVAFLDRIIRSGRKKFPEDVTLESAVNDSPIDWREEVLNRDGLDSFMSLCPVLSAFKAASAVPAGESWSTIYGHATGIQADAKIRPSDLADQVYLEGLLHKAWIETP